MTAEKAAEKLRGDFRHVISIPRELCTPEEIETGGPGSEYDRLRPADSEPAAPTKETVWKEDRGVIAPFWNALRKDLAAGQYPNLLTLRERLLGRLAEAREAYGEAVTVDKPFGLLEWLIEDSAEGREHQTLYETLGDAPELPEGAPFGWLTEYRGENGLPVYIPVLSERTRKNLGCEIPEIPFNGGSTWNEALETARAKRSRVREQAERAYRPVGILLFRLQVLEAVLTEYEAFGYVRNYEDLDERDIVPPAVGSALPIVETALRLYDEGPGAYESRDSLLMSVAAQPGMYSDKGYLVRKLKAVSVEVSGEKVPLYETMERKPTKEESKRLLVHTVNIFRAFVNNHGMG